jgi:hypothetical protein
MKNGVAKEGKKGKSQGIENVWVWIRPHIGFCTIRKCDHGQK